MVDNTEDIEKINKLAKTLKDSGLANSSKEAMKMAEGMTSRNDKTIQDIDKVSEHSKEKPKEESFTAQMKEKFGSLIENVEETLHIKEKDNLNLAEKEDVIDRSERDADIKDNVEEMVQDIKDELKETKKDDTEKIEDLKEELDEVKKDLDEIEGGQK